MTPRGFIALISVMVIGLTLLALVASASARALFAGFDAVDAEHAAEAYAAARSCADVAGLLTVRDESYAGGDTVAVGGAECRIDSVEGGIVYTSAEYGGAVAHIRATLEDGRAASVAKSPTSRSSKPSKRVRALSWTAYH